MEAAQAARAVQLERLTQRWSAAVLVLTLLYIFIGPTPFSREIALDAATGAATVSPVNRFIWIGLLALAAPLLWIRRAEFPAALGRLAPLILLFGWFWLTTLWAIDPGVASRRFILYVVALGVSLAVALGLGGLRRMHAVLALACGIMVAIDLVSTAAAPGLSMTPFGLAAIHNHKNTLGAAMLFSCIVLGPFALARETWGQRLGWGALFLGAVGLLIASQSKTSIALLAVTVATAPVLLVLLRARVVVFYAVLAGLGLAVLAALLGWLAWCTYMARDPMAPLQGITFTRRTEVWAFVFSQIVKHPIIGSGFGSFWDIDPRLQPSLQSNLWFAQSDAFTNQAHNGYLDLLATTGLVGLTGGLILLIRWVVRGLGLIRGDLGRADARADRAHFAAAAALGLFPLVLFGHNWMESSYFTANAMFGTIILLVAVQLELEGLSVTGAARSGRASPRR
ncbi:O-antigen ligase family protein [Phenylobacterium sp. VNQ135]|uniref:O-antigen ligase family protein n=1 Tax=Phenylobacterium sp. VNQ135 TaxID=3400922 RepID=UPI003C0DB59D